MAVQGSVRGGQPVVAGATIQLYAVGTTGDGSAATPMLASPVTADQNGNFSLNSLYNCDTAPITPTTEVYVVATGGNPGLSSGSNNPNLSMMAALGQCSTLSTSTIVVVNELTTTGAIAALYPYMSSYANLGSGSSDAAAFDSAFSAVQEYVNTTTGSAPGPTLPAGDYAATSVIETIADIVSACINSPGGTAGDGSPCGNLFNFARSSGGVAPTDTIGAILNILNNPSENVSQLFGLIPPNPPFPSTLTSAPASWVTAISYSIGGPISPNSCQSVAPDVNLTLSQGSTTIQTTTSSSGTYSFTNVPNGTYTVTPSLTGPSSVFYPASRSITINGAARTNVSFIVAVGYTVSGTVSYGGAKTGTTYLTLTDSCGGGGALGTAIATDGTFTIHGAAPGNYSLLATMDNLGFGALNASNPNSTDSPVTFTVSTSDYTGTTVTLTDPPTVTLSQAPSITSVSAFNNGVVALYNPITNNAGVELPASYTLQWSTASSFTSITGSRTFPASGTQTDAFFLNSINNPTLTNGSTYYFRLYASSAGTAVSPYSNVFGPITVGAPTGGNTVTGEVTFSSAPTGPLYVAFYDFNSNEVYGEYISNPVSAQAYSIQVPTSSTYQFVALLDQNNDGLVDAPDVSNIQNAMNQNPTTISGPTANEDLTLPSANASATVITGNTNLYIPPNSSEYYTLGLNVTGQIKRPVAVTLESGPNALNPIDISVCGYSYTYCSSGFNINLYDYTTPNVGDTYQLLVTYEDGTTQTLSTAVTGVSTAFPTGASPESGTSTSLTPTFAWTDPSNASQYTYFFSICCAGPGDIWDIPGNNSNGPLTSSTTSITWGVDPTGGTDLPTINQLVSGTTYYWLIRAQDSNGNYAQTQTQYEP
jgi:hypothetical protein